MTDDEILYPALAFLAFVLGLVLMLWTLIDAGILVAARLSLALFVMLICPVLLVSRSEWRSR